MPRAGLSRQTIVEAAICLIEERGYQAFTLRELAKHLGVQASSLYNHVGNLDDILAGVGTYAVSALNEMEFSAIAGVHGDAAIRALAEAYRRFAREHPALYQVVMSLHRTDKAAIEQTARPITEPFLRVLGEYPRDREAAMHWQRVLRSILHGFLSQEEAGYFCHLPVDQEESFSVAITCYIDGLHAVLEKKAKM